MPCTVSRDIVHAHHARTPVLTASKAAATLGTIRSATSSVATDASESLMMAASDDLRDQPASSGYPGVQQFTLARQQRKVLLYRLAEAYAGVEHDAPGLPTPSASSRAALFFKKSRHLLGHITSSWVRATCMVVGSRCMCIRQTPQPPGAGTPPVMRAVMTQAPRCR